MLQGLEHVRMEKQPQAAQATLFARGKVKHYLHCFHGLRRIIAYHSNVNSSESIIVYPHVACCLCAFCVRVQVRDAARGTNSQDRKRSHSLYLVRLELNKIWHGVASLDLSDFQRFLGIRESLFFGSHVSFGVLWEFGKAGAILKAVLCALMCLL